MIIAKTPWLRDQHWGGSYRLNTNTSIPYACGIDVQSLFDTEDEVIRFVIHDEPSDDRYEMNVMWFIPEWVRLTIDGQWYYDDFYTRAGAFLKRFLKKHGTGTFYVECEIK